MVPAVKQGNGESPRPFRLQFPRLLYGKPSKLGRRETGLALQHSTLSTQRVVFKMHQDSRLWQMGPGAKKFENQDAEILTHI